ncbi:MAG TPA: DinB family protein [Bacteroidia bacterium]|nr:DinB family protein [Bacteroidia bacterium]
MQRAEKQKTTNSQIQSLLKELEQESKTTRKMLAIVPTDKFDWKPHAKSMNIQKLATHIAELPEWVTMTLTTSGLDFASNPYNPVTLNTTTDLMTYFEKALADGKAHLEKASDADLIPDWTLSNGEQILNKSSKAEVIRMVYCQIVHHRAQLGVYLRLLNISIPGSYGPSADELGL